MTDVAVSVNHLTFSFGHREVLKDLSLQIPTGIAFGLLGPNGAGKTTLIRLLVGLLKPKSGDIHILGQLISRKKALFIGYMPQLQSLYNELTVRQNVEFFARIYRLHDKAKRTQQVEKVLKLVDLWERRNDAVQSLSGGMKQRTSMACAIVHNPPLLFLDEPTVGLDPELRVSFWEFFSTLTKQGATLIISSHTMDDAAHCDRLGFIRDGKVIAEGTPNELKLATGTAQTSLEDAFLYFVRQGKDARND
ncbi:MAG: ABC transporter ATP-binding protein [Chloroflexi bacterium]|nr:ABC transporter ATP-binding protein [Chloroflexota bacterium]